MGVYFLIAVGAATAVTNAERACASWPVCGGGWSFPATTIGWVAFGHRLVAVVVGLLVLVTTILAWRRDVSTRVRMALTTSFVLYPIQAALGAVIAFLGAPVMLSAIHLVIAMVIFGGLIAALAWRLETETGDPDDVPTAPPEPDLPPTAEGSPDIPNDRVARAKLTASAYYRLMKPRLMWLLCLVASAAMALAGGKNLDPGIVLATLGGGMLSIGASGTFNHVLERDIDRRMKRTSDRPLATELVPVRNAIAFGLLLTVASLTLFAWVNLLAAALGLTAIVFYSVVYTLILKPNTVQNTVIGGAAGALPAFIGWAAVTGTIGLGGLALAAVIFLWTPAHFYNLALAYKDDYERGGFPMMPVVRGETATRRHIVWYLAATLVATAVLSASKSLGWMYVVTGVVFGGVFLWAVVRLHYEQTEAAAFRSFHASNAFLGALLVAIVIDALAF